METIIKPKSTRLDSLDVFRGITIAGMILVNNAGDWGHIYWALGHAKWHGWTPTDFIFPFFLFIVGVSMVLSFKNRLDKGDSRNKLFKHTLARAIMIFGFGIFLNLFPFFNLTTVNSSLLLQIFVIITMGFLVAYLLYKPIIPVLFSFFAVIMLFSVIFPSANLFNPIGRLPGVLQRIGIVYLIASSIYLYCTLRWQIILAVFFLFAYWFMMAVIPVPGIGANVLTAKENFAAYIDNMFLSGHMWVASKTWDPEGLLSTLPAITTCLIGVFTGLWLGKEKSKYEIVSGIFFPGIVLTVIGVIWDMWFPINKNIWTSSYVVFMGGMALLFLGFCYYLIEIKNLKKWGYFFRVFGLNAIAVYFLSGIMARMLNIIKFDVNGFDGIPIPGGASLKQIIYDNLFRNHFGNPYNDSVAYSIIYVLLWYCVIWVFYKKKWFVKV